MCSKWMSLCRDTLESALRVENLLDVLKGSDPESEQQLLAVHVKFLISVIRRFMEFGLMYQHYPWRFFLLTVGDVGISNSVLSDMKEEWEFLMTLEKTTCHQQWPLKAVPHLSWFVYREVMTAAEECNWTATADLVERVQSWFPQPCSTLGADAVFKHQRFGEQKQQRNEVSLEQLMACAAKSLNERYSEFQTPKDLDFNGIRPSDFIKKSATSSDTGLVGFNAMVKVSAVSPHHLTRKSLNIWDAMKATKGKHTSFWTAQLARSGQAQPTE
eukprot:Skav204912  [mRNA]  locus=scaffold1506:6188:7003:- [translate_table: standard]